MFFQDYSCDYDKPVIRLINKSDLSDDLNKGNKHLFFKQYFGIEELK